MARTVKKHNVYKKLYLKNNDILKSEKYNDDV